jgi:hypothetical protein
MLDQFHSVVKDLEQTGTVDNELLVLGETLVSLFKRPDVHETGTKLLPKSEKAISLDKSVFPSTLLQRNTLLSALLKAEPRFAPYSSVMVKENVGVFSFVDITSALANTMTSTDGENYIDDYSTWGAKEFDLMADMMANTCISDA